MDSRRPSPRRGEGGKRRRAAGEEANGGVHGVERRVELAEAAAEEAEAEEAEPEAPEAQERKERKKGGAGKTQRHRHEATDESTGQCRSTD